MIHSPPSGVDEGTLLVTMVLVAGPVEPPTPNESNKLPNELSSAISEDPKSSSPIPFTFVGGLEGGGACGGGACGGGEGTWLDDWIVVLMGGGLAMGE